MASTHALVKEIKANEQDFEWYPSSDEIIQEIKSDLTELRDFPYISVLDVGAGDGRVLEALTEGKKYAIEKSEILVQAMPPDVFVVGTDFFAQTLIDKQVSCVFSNPPYSEYEEWAVKIITEANAAVIYLVLPIRWQNSHRILASLKSRGLRATPLKTFDFLNADRAARATVHLVRVDFDTKWRSGRFNEIASDPFTLWFEQNFKIETLKDSLSKYDIERSQKAAQKDQIETGLVTGGDLVEVLENLYTKELQTLINTYKKLEEIDGVLLKELNVDMKGLREALKLKITNLKDVYWRELFDNLSQVTEKLATKSRANMLKVLTEHTHVDFSQANARAILIWVIKNANGYLDSQIIDLVKRMSEQACIVRYQSNQNTYKDEQWRYGTTPENLAQYALDYRVVLHRVGGIHLSRFSWETDKAELTSCATDLISDILTVASNLGFDMICSRKEVASKKWTSGKAESFYFKDHRTGLPVVLCEVRAFKNQNLHIKFNQQFLMRLNVEFGRLMGWLRDWSDAVDEMGANPVEARAAWGANKLLTADVLKLGKISD